MEKIIERIKKIVGEENLSREKAVLAQKAVDLYALRLYTRHVGWQPTLPLAVVSPGDTQELAEVIKICYSQSIPVIPYGGGSGVLGGAENRSEKTIVLDLSRLNQLLALDEENLIVTAGAGMYLKDLEALLEEKGYKTGHKPQSVDQAQIGGLVATRSTGQFSTGYGGIEDILIGLEAVLADGSIVRIKNVPRRATGPDLRQLFLGSEGALAVITEVSWKIFPLPEAVWKRAYRVQTMRQGLDIIGQIMRTGIRPAVIRLHDWLESEKPYGAFMEEDESILLFWSEGRQEMVAAEAAIITKIAENNQAISAGSKPVEIWYRHRNDAADEYEKYGAQGLLVDTIEVAAGWSDIADIYEETVDRVYYSIPEIVYFSGHSSHSYLNGTNIYFEMAAFPEASEKEAERIYTAVWSTVMEVALEYEGTIGHHHGIGKQRTPWIEKEHGSSYILLTKLKEILDDKKILNPGCLLPLENE